MLKTVLAGVLIFGAQVVTADWPQCGGIGWTGSTACPYREDCVYINEYYSQCTPPGEPIRRAATASTIASTSTAQSSTASVAATNICTTPFVPITAKEAFAGLNPGWNLGNTLDAIPTEGSWNNPPVQPITFAEIHAKGFKSIRLPTTWAYHFIDASPTWNINTTWMDRVETVVDEALATGAYVILNAHHDSWIWADVTAAGANYTEIEERFGRLWSQIGTRFACKSSKLIFEPINEPPGTDQANADELNKLEGIFLTSINEAGGHNPQRVVSLCGMQMNAALTAQFFVRGSLYPSQPWGLQFHYYSPYDFIFSAWGKTIWGSDADKASLLNDFQLFYGNFTTVPAFVGEFDASPATTETAGRWKWFDYITRVAKSFDYSLIVWDNGDDHFNRSADTWNDPVVIDIWFDAIFGENNTLADSTTDPTALTQFSSAYIFHEVGTPVVAETATYLLNGNHFLSIETAAGVRLNPSQYSFSSNGTLTLSASYLSTLYTSTSAPGVLETLSLCFSEGSSLSLTIVQYGLPVVSQTTWNITTQLATGLDLWIPITWAGLPEPAAVKAILADGTYMVDTWTVYLPPLQQACWTEGDWSWNAGGQDNFVVTQAGLGVMQASGEDVTLTVEFFPRSLGQNQLNLTFVQ